MSDDAYRDGLDLIEIGALQEVDNTLRGLVAEVERLRRIEAAARAAHEAERAWSENGGMNPGLAGAMCDAQTTLRKLLEAGK